MDKFLILLKLCYKFSKKYMPSYLNAVLKPILYGSLGILFLFMTMINPIFVLLGFFSIPLTCYAFWKGYVITYALIPCAHNFIKNTALPFENFVNEVKKNESSFAIFVCFMAILSVILYLPTVVEMSKTIPFSLEFFANPMNLARYSSKIDNIILINTILAAPFLNYGLCAYYYKKDSENFLDFFINCYRKLDIYGLALAVVIVLFSYKGALIYLLLAIFLNPFIYSINTFWYSTRCKK